jgi:hypothetical protein
MLMIPTSKTKTLAAALLAVLVAAPAVAQTSGAPATPELTSPRERIIADRKEFDRGMKLDTKRPWDGTRPGMPDPKDPDRPIPAPAIPE